jgi:hypothetical protein
MSEIHVHILDTDGTLLEDLIVSDEYWKEITLARRIAETLEYSFKTRDTTEEETIY